MSDERGLLGLINDGCFGYESMNTIYDLYENEVIILILISVFISIILHVFFNERDFKTSNNNQIDVIKYSFLIKTGTLFIILMTIFIPIFKLMGTNYFL